MNAHIGLDFVDFNGNRITCLQRLCEDGRSDISLDFENGHCYRILRAQHVPIDEAMQFVEQCTKELRMKNDA